jgi:hypothetical protein
MFSLKSNLTILSCSCAAAFGSYAAEAPAKFKVGEFMYTRPAKWEWVEVTSAMRKAQLKVVDEKAKGAGEVVFFAGNMGGVQANVERWFGQFQDGRDKKTEEVPVGKHKVTYASIQGTYQSGMPGGAKTAMKDHALLGAIVTSPQGDVYVRLTGPVALVNGAALEFRKMVEDALK